MMRMTTGWFLVYQTVEGAVLAISMTQTMPRPRRKHSAVRIGPEKGMEQMMGRGNRK
jgi:hypothetical protein